MTLSTRAPIENRLLKSLPKKEYQRLLPQLEHVPMTFGDILYEPGERIRHVYFPNNSVVSLLTTVEEREALEVGLVGNEGMAGISAFMGVDTSYNQAIVQGAGTAMKMKATTLRKEADELNSLNRLLNRYTHSLLTQISQSAACIRFHKVDERLARWLLLTRDRVGADEFRLTQEFMSKMLGVRREGVSVAASALQKNGLINYRRGVITVLDRAGLEAASCKCYRVVKDQNDSFLN